MTAAVFTIIALTCRYVRGLVTIADVFIDVTGLPEQLLVSLRIITNTHPYF